MAKEENRIRWGVKKSIYNPINIDVYLRSYRSDSKHQGMSPQETMQYETNSLLKRLEEVEGPMITVAQKAQKLKDALGGARSKDGVVSLTVHYIPSKTDSEVIQRLRFTLDFISQNPADRPRYELVRRAMLPLELRTANEDLSRTSSRSA